MTRQDLKLRQKAMREGKDPDYYVLLFRSEKVRKRTCAYTRAHARTLYENTRKWRRNNPDKVRVLDHRRKARKRNAGGSWTAAEWETLKRQFGFRCVSCGKTETELRALERRLVPDHIQPLSKGGLNDITNLQPLCHGRGGCNNKKSAKFHDFVIS